MHEHSLFPPVDGSLRVLAIAAAIAILPASAVGAAMRVGRRVSPLAARSALTRVAAACATATLVATVPLSAGNGSDAFRRVAAGTSISVGILVILAAAKAFGCLLAIGSGTPGGLITPTLTVGGAASAACAMALHDHGIAASTSVWTVAAIGAAFTLAIVVEIPLTAGLLVAELTGSTIVACVAGGCIVIGLLAGRTARQVPFRRRAPRIHDEDA
jgi:H+/Cl- antiporter ClcA